MPASNEVRVRVEGLLEHERHAAALERARGVRRGLERERAVEQRGELVGGELGAGEEVARQARKCTAGSLAPMLVLSWNLFHGRAQPAAGRPLAAEFAAALAGWSWDVALLQEVPPWWPAPLAAATGASARMALTSRNSLLAVRRAIASRNPDLLGANGGGCNAILVRGGTIGAHRDARADEAARATGGARDRAGRRRAGSSTCTPRRTRPSSAAPTC